MRETTVPHVGVGHDSKIHGARAQGTATYTSSRDVISDGATSDLATALWPHLLEAIAAGSHRMVLHSPSGRRVVLLSEDELQRLEAQAYAPTLADPAEPAIHDLLERAPGDRVDHITSTLEASRMRPRSTECRAAPLLTPRESEVLVLIDEGLSGAQIASRLGLSANTIAQHLVNVRRKYGVRSSAAAAAAARQAGDLPEAAACA
jgi:DNA-binding NarL/FixJ family response regulator